MARKDKKNAKVEVAQPAKPEPFKYTFRPVQIETPVEIIQSFKYVSSSNQEFSNPMVGAPVAAAEPEKKGKKKRRK